MTICISIYDTLLCFYEQTMLIYTFTTNTSESFLEIMREKQILKENRFL